MGKFLNISTDTTLGGENPSDSKISSEKAIKTYIDAHAGGGAVDSVNGKTGAVVLTASDVGAQNAFNTSYPLELSTQTIGAPHNYTILGTSAVAQYSSQYMYSSWIYGDEDNLVFQNDNVSTVPTCFEDIFDYQLSYIEVPVNYADYITALENGDITDFSVRVNTGETNKSSNDLWILGSKINGSFNPIVVLKSSANNNSGATYMCNPDNITGTETGKIKYGKYSTGYTTASVQVASSGKRYSALVLRFTAGNTYYDLFGDSDNLARIHGEYIKPSLSYNDLLKRINCVRYYSGATSSSEIPTFTTTEVKYSGTNWTLASGITTSYSMNLLYDGVTLKKTGSNQLYADLSGKQDTLVSGANIKTINNESILGSGNITVSGGSLPSQTGNAGKFLTTDGTDASWATVDTLSISKGLTYASGNVFPVLSENGTMGGESPAASSSSTEGSNYYAYKAFTADRLNDFWGPSSGSVPQDITYYTPTAKVVATALYTFKKASEVYSAGTLYGSNDNSEWTTLGSFSGNTATSVLVEVQDLTAYKYFKTIFTAKSVSGYGKAHITLTERISSTIMADIDGQTLVFDGNKIKADIVVPEAGTGLVKAFINEAHAPYLTSNGTIGGSSNACTASMGTDSAYNAYRGTGYTWNTNGNSGACSSTYYNATPVCLSSAVYTGDGFPNSCYLYGSINGETWDLLGSFEYSMSPKTLKSTSTKKYKYFKSDFPDGTSAWDMNLRIDLTFGTPAYSVNVDNNSVRVSSSNKLYVPETRPEVAIPLTYDILNVGGMTSYTIDSGYLKPTYPSNLQFYFYSGQSYVSVMNSNVSTPTSVAEAFTQTSYIDIPCDVDKMVAKVRAGEINSVNCLFSSLTNNNNAYQSPAWIAGKWDGTNFTPLLFGYAGGYGGEVTFLTGGYTTGGEYENGFTVDSTTTTYGSTQLNDGAGFAITYNGSVWQVTCSYLDPYYGAAMDYHTTTVTSAQIDKLAQINVVRYVNMNGNSTASYNPTVAGFGYNNSTWTPADGAQKFYTLALNYDNNTLKVDGSNKLYADVQGGSLPDQTGQSGKFLTTDGTDASWSNIPTEIPSQSGNSGKFLTTNGTTTSWATVGAGGTVDQTYDELSTNAQSGTAVAQALMSLSIIDGGAI